MPITWRMLSMSMSPIDRLWNQLVKLNQILQECMNELYKCGSFCSGLMTGMAVIGNPVSSDRPTEENCKNDLWKFFVKTNRIKIRVVIDNGLYRQLLFLIVIFNTWYYLYFIYLEKKTNLEIWLNKYSLTDIIMKYLRSKF